MEEPCGWVIWRFAPTDLIISYKPIGVLVSTNSECFTEARVGYLVPEDCRQQHVWQDVFTNLEDSTLGNMWSEEYTPYYE